MDAGKCILRVTKLKSAGGVSGYARHNTRERETPNADAKKRKENTHLVGPDKADQVMSVWRDRVSKDENPRKNAVVALDYMVHASPTALTPEAREKYLKDALAWIIKRHGKENVVQATIHRDERTPAHLHVIVVPLHRHEGRRNNGKMKLNAGHWTDGRKKLSEMQTEFHKEVGLKYGLERGLMGSKAKHQEVKRFYALVAEPFRGIKVEVERPPRLGAFYDLDDWKRIQSEGLSEGVSKAIQPLLAKARLAETVSERNRALEHTNRNLAKTRDKLHAVYEEWLNVALNMPIEDLRLLREAHQREALEKTAPKEKGRDRDRGGMER